MCVVCASRTKLTHFISIPHRPPHPPQFNGSALILCYGLENLVDLFSSMIVLWRFFSPSDDEARIALLQRREKRASVAISFTLALLGVTVLAAALDDFRHGEESTVNLNRLVALGVVSLFVFGALSAFKFHYADCLQSASLRKDAICSLLGAILSGSLFINSLIILNRSSAWWLDPLVAFSVASASLLYGLSSIYRAYVVKGIPVCDIRWWVSSQGGTDGDESPPDELAMEQAGDQSAGEKGMDNQDGDGVGADPESEIV